MITPKLLKTLESREVLHLKERDLDVRLYDTDQILIMGIEHRDGRTYHEGNKRITEELEIPAQAAYNLRTGSGYYNLVTKRTDFRGFYGGSNVQYLECFPKGMEMLRQQGVDLNKWKIEDDDGHNQHSSYPELEEFCQDLRSTFAVKKWERHELAIKGLLPTLIGEGSIPPWSLLHPYVMFGLVAGTVFPYERKTFFDFEKGLANLQKRNGYMTPEEGASYDGNVVLIRPWSIGDKNGRYQTVLEAHFFNPVNHQKIIDGKLKPNKRIPSRKDCDFEVVIGRECSREWLHFNVHSFSPERAKKEGLLDKGKYDIYLKADEDLVQKLEKISPLFLI